MVSVTVYVLDLKDPRYQLYLPITSFRSVKENVRLATLIIPAHYTTYEITYMTSKFAHIMIMLRCMLKTVFLKIHTKNFCILALEGPRE